MNLFRSILRGAFSRQHMLVTLLITCHLLTLSSNRVSSPIFSRITTDDAGLFSKLCGHYPLSHFLESSVGSAVEPRAALHILTW